MYQVYLTTNSKSIKVVIGTAFMGRCSCGTVVWFANIRKQAKDHKSYGSAAKVDAYIFLTHRITVSAQPPPTRNGFHFVIYTNRYNPVTPH